MKNILFSIVLFTLSFISFAEEKEPKNVNLNDGRVEAYLDKMGILSKIDPDLSFSDQYQNKTRYVLVQYCGAVAVFDLYNSGSLNIIHKNDCISAEEQAKIFTKEMNDKPKETFARTKFLK
ncbi:hypothetical protein [Flammeovirga sp. SJP92]|uniref:hypothetical protein n=1 Tax=Flammeovirga sp. SJP92 TaxID=1775430 RepID=UPI00078822D1|nr:hypothetical protein [Flammeovirga sp. SJP92]KXX67913.1 hypothetical protein AVL50_23945 [Flammeovirga sp. SJP92]